MVEREPALPMDLPASEPTVSTLRAQRCRFCRKALSDAGEIAWGACSPCIDNAEFD